jgi:hypothetical protein
VGLRTSPVPRLVAAFGVLVAGVLATGAVSTGFDSGVSAVPQGVQNVAGLGTTYVDTTTDGGDWYLVGYGANGNVGRLDSQNGTFDAGVRTGSATLNAATFAQGATEVAFAWTTAGGSFPTGGLGTYDTAVSFVLPAAASMTLTGAASPASGTGAANFSIVGTSADQSTVRVKDIVGTSGLPRYMFMRNKTLGVRYGTAYGVVSNPQINNQLDWNPDGQNFRAVYAGHDGTNGYFTTGGTSNGYTPATMSVWLRKPAECTESPTANGSRRVVKFTRIGTCTWTPPAGVSSVDVLVVAGGGGAGDGGGGAGGVLEQSSFAVAGPVSVTVGQGGAGSRFHFVRQVDNGRPSKFDSIVATGGGGGGQYGGSTFGASGGSGGGSSADYTNAANKSTGVAGQGYGGGVSCAGGYGGPGGGGGAGGVGQNGGPTASANNLCTGANTGQNPTRGGNGGDGIQSSITGTAEWYGGGGGGGVNTNSGPANGGSQGGQGGGGTGAWCANCTGGNATDATGGGGGGGDAEGRGGDGGNGVVIISYVQPVATTTTSSTTTTVAPTTTVRGATTTTAAPALEIVVSAPSSTAASSQSTLPGVSVPSVTAPAGPLVLKGSSSSTTVPAGVRTVASSTTSTTVAKNAGGTVAPPVPKIAVVAAGEAGVKIGNKTENATVTRVDNQLVVSAGPLKATLGGVDQNGSPRVLDRDGNVRLKPGDTVRIRLSGFEPGSQVEAWLFSTPVLMGRATVSGDGSVTGNFVIPKDVPSGAHRIAIVARTADGKPATLTVGVKVGEWKRESSITTWLIVLPIVLAVASALVLPATRRRRRAA